MVVRASCTQHVKCTESHFQPPPPHTPLPITDYCVRTSSGKSAKEEEKADAKAPINSKDSGAVEIVVARLSTDASTTTTSSAKSKIKQLDDNEAHLSVHLYYRRESHSGQKTWVLISKVNCLPDRGDNGAMVVAFREKAKRELSKFKAPVFPLPSAFALNSQLHLVVHAGGEGGGGGDGRGGGRAAPRILGEVKFYVKDLLKSDARQLSTSLTVVNTQTKYGEVASKSGQVVGAAAGVQR